MLGCKGLKERRVEIGEKKGYCLCHLVKGKLNEKNLLTVVVTLTFGSVCLRSSTPLPTNCSSDIF